jgi:hypothetical protein
MRWVVHMARMGEMRSAHELLIGRPHKEDTTWDP